MSKIIKFINKILLLQEVLVHSFVASVLLTISFPFMIIVFPLSSILEGLIAFSKNQHLLIQNEIDFLKETYRELEELQNEN